MTRSTAEIRAGRAQRVALLIAMGATLALLSPSPAGAQACPVGRSCFYVPPALPTPPGYTVGWDLVISSPRGTITGTWTAGTGAPSAFSVSPGSPLVVPLSTTRGAASTYHTAETRGIFVEASSAELVVNHRLINGPWQSSSTIKNATYALGTRFRLGSYNLNGNSSADTGFDYTSVYAPFGATVTFTAPPGASLPFWGASAMASFSVTLAAGQTYVARTIPGAVCTREQVGGLVTSSDPIAVSVGGRGWSEVCGVSGGCGDDGADNILPVTGVGTQYVLHDFPSTAAAGEDVTVVADVDGTQVRVNGALVATLNAGQVHRRTLSGLVYLETSRPATVYQNSGLAGCEIDIAIIPPIVLAPIGQWVTDFNVSGSGRVGLVIATANLATLRLDGAVPTLVSSTLVPGRPDLTAVQFNVTGGNHSVRAAADFQLGLVTATGGTGLFGYFTPFRIPGCGDGTVSASEGCDDGNVDDGDGCSSSCRIEIGEPGCTDSDDCVPSGRCDMGTCVARCSSDAACNDSNPCTVDLCNGSGACENTAVAAGGAGACTGGLVCSGGAAGTCVECVGDAQCPGGRCRVATNTCVECLGAADCADDGNECTVESCSAAGDCGATSQPLGTACTAGVCNGSASAPACVACVDDVAGSGADTGCAIGAPFCDTSGGGAVCVACLADADCNDGNGCTADSCVAGACIASSLAAGTACAGGVCNGAASAPACVTCIDSSATSTDAGCAGGAPFCDASGAAPVCVECLGAADCGDGLECTLDACVLGACAVMAAPIGTACSGGVCDGTATAGACVDCVDDRAGGLTDSGCAADAPRCDVTTRTCVECFAAADCDDGNDCTTDACSAGACSATPVSAGTTCGGGVCDGDATAPECVVCVDDAAGAGEDSGCTSGAPVCDTSGATPVCTGCLTDTDCDDGNECTSDACVSGVCTPTSLTAGSACTGGVCDGETVTPECVACVDDATNPTPDSGCAGASPFCDTTGASPVCVGCTSAADCDDGNACTTDACEAGSCAQTSLPAGTTCEGGVCDGATSAPACVTCVDDASGAEQDSGCTSTAALCDTSAEDAVCVPCLDTGDVLDDGCAAPDEVCVASAGTNACVSCADTASGGALDFGCAEAAPLCVSREGAVTCVECVDDSTCGTGEVCNVELGACAPGCNDTSDCMAPTPICDTDDGLCVECLADDDCAGRDVCAEGNACEAPDHDGDGVPDDVDLDDDNDGVPDLAELGGTDLSVDSDDDGIADFEDSDAVECTDAGDDGICDELPGAVDFDGDGVPNHLDLDADGDGLTDLVEGGGTDSNGDGRVDGFADANGNGLDDRLMASPLPLPDSDDEGGPDFLDLDADGDSVPDATEGTDADHDGEPDVIATGRDTDGDGLDDAFDPDQDGTTASRPDTDGDGTSDWRDPDDDDDGVPTIDEDPNGDDDPTNDDSDGDGTPDYLDPNEDAPRGGFSGGALCAVRSGAGDSSFALALVLAALVLARRRRARR